MIQAGRRRNAARPFPQPCRRQAATHRRRRSDGRAVIHRFSPAREQFVARELSGSIAHFSGNASLASRPVQTTHRTAPGASARWWVRSTASNPPRTTSAGGDSGLERSASQATRPRRAAPKTRLSGAVRAGPRLYFNGKRVIITDIQRQHYLNRSARLARAAPRDPKERAEHDSHPQRTGELSARQ